MAHKTLDGAWSFGGTGGQEPDLRGGGTMAQEELKRTLDELGRAAEYRQAEPRVITEADYFRRLLSTDGYTFVIINPERPNPLWIEIKPGAEPFSLTEEGVRAPCDQYGKTYRCWTGHPTREQMEAAPWEE